MIRSAIRFIVHAMFGVGVLSAFGLFDSANAGNIGNTVATGAVKVGSSAVTRQLRGSSDADQVASATSQSQSPKVLNRWDMQRRQGDSSQSGDSVQTGEDAVADTQPERPVTAAKTIPAGPIVVTLPPETDGVRVTTKPAGVTAASAVTAPREIAENQVVCIAGCR